MTGAAYRPCVGIMLTNADGHAFVGQRLDSTAEAWQMPQGGIDPGETPLTAALRELFEETGVHADDVSVMAETDGWLRYDLPPELQGKLWGGRFVGQEQKWFLMRLNAPDSAINIATEIPEFGAWQWLPPAKLSDAIVPFKRDVYARVLAEFQPMLESKPISVNR